MGGRGSSSGGGGKSTTVYQIQQSPPNIVATPTQAVQANKDTFNSTDSTPYHDLKNARQYFQSQNLNYAMATGQKLTANQQYVHDQLQASMHNLGENLNLTRYDHDGFVNNMLQQNGIRAKYDQIPLSQLKSALVGKTYGEERFVSTSYNDFANAPQSAKNVFMNRAVKITYKAAANTQAMMPGNGTGGNLGEIVLKPSGGKQNYKIVDVKYTGQSARLKGTQSFSLPQIELVVETNGD